MPDFTSTPHCLIRAHCAACRTNSEWRKIVGAPDECPHGVKDPGNIVAPATEYRRAEAGSLLWSELHTVAYNYPECPTEDDARTARAWLADFTRRVRETISGCGCQSDWQQIMTHCPPPLDTGRSFYWWTVAVHDRINHHLNKPLASPTWSPGHPAFRFP